MRRYMTMLAEAKTRKTLIDIQLAQAGWNVNDHTQVIEEFDIGHWAIRIVALLEKIALMRSHFLAPKRIAALFKQRNSAYRIQNDGATAWVIIDKPAAG